MLNKLENARLRATTARTGRVIAACVLGASILAGTAMTVNSAPRNAGWGQLVLHDRGTVGTLDLAGLQEAGWRRGSGGPGMLQRLSDQDIEERLTRVVRHVAIEIDATQEQVDKIVAIVTPVAIGLKETQRDLSTVGDDLRALLLAQDVDRFAIEALRAEKIALADEVSKTLTGMMIDVSAVLTPAQRSQLDERIKEFRAKRPGFRHR